MEDAKVYFAIFTFVMFRQFYVFH